MTPFLAPPEITPTINHQGPHLCLGNTEFGKLGRARCGGAWQRVPHRTSSQEMFANFNSNDSHLSLSREADSPCSLSSSFSPEAFPAPGEWLGILISHILWKDFVFLIPELSFLVSCQVCGLLCVYFSGQQTNNLIKSQKELWPKTGSPRGMSTCSRLNEELMEGSRRHQVS